MRLEILQKKIKPLTLKNFFFIIIILYMILPLQADQKTDRLELHFFGSKTCGECLQIKKKLLTPLIKKYPKKLKINIYDIEDEEDFSLLIKFEEVYNLKKSSAQVLFFPTDYLNGYEEIMAQTEKKLNEYLNDPAAWTTKGINKNNLDTKGTIKKNFQKFSFLAILTAGLIDGINPCAIAGIIFLISFLISRKKKRSEILTIGLAYTIAVYITYLLIGLGLFKALQFLQEYTWTSLTIKWSAVAFAGVIGIISFWDAFAFKKSKKTKNIKLQLPKAVKLKMHKVIHGNLSGKQLISGAIITGFLVTLLEAVCTGQVYLPTIVLMTRTSGLQLTGWLYLLFYNFLFVLPLLIIMVLAYYGLTWKQLSKATQKNLPVLKTLLGCAMICLAVFLAMSL